MKVKVFLFIGVIFSFACCEKHVCNCREYKGEQIINEYEKEISPTLSCDELNKIKYIDCDTIQVICGDSNPL